MDNCTHPLLKLMASPAANNGIKLHCGDCGARVGEVWHIKHEGGS